MVKLWLAESWEDAHLAKEVARIDEATVAGRSWTMKGRELNLLAWTMNER